MSMSPQPPQNHLTLSQRLRQFDPSQPWVRLLLIFLVGVLLGWIVLGWALFPVRWTQVYPNDLRADIRNDYLAMTADSYAVTQDLEQAARRLQYWPPEEIGPILYQRSTILESQGRTQDAQRLRQLGERLLLSPLGEPGATTIVISPDEESASGVNWGMALLFVLALTVLVALGYILYRLGLPWPRHAPTSTRASEAPVIEISDAAPQTFADNEEEVGPPTTLEPDTIPSPESGEDDEDVYPPDIEDDDDEGALAEEAPQAEEGEEERWQEYQADWEDEAPPPPTTEPVTPVTPAAQPRDARGVQATNLARFDGDPDYNDIFPIEEGDTYLGEYGAGVAETGRDNPNYVYTMEVWLFDKSDIRTVSAILMHPDVYADPNRRQEVVSAANDSAPLQPGATVRLQTSRLALEGRVRRVEFGNRTGEGIPLRLLEIDLTGRSSI